jgi:hypothetical protein
MINVSMYEVICTLKLNLISLASYKLGTKLQ